jgi:hypothetical protein
VLEDWRLIGIRGWFNIVASVIEPWYVTAPRQVDENGIRLTVSLIVLCQLAANPPGRDPHGRILSWIERSVSLEDFDSNDIFLQKVGLSGECALDGEPQEGAELLRVLKEGVG